jgi:entericidin B
MFPFDVIDESKKVINIYRKEREMKRKIVAAVVLLMCLWTLSGCHTVKGVGQDVESGGRAIERSSGK